MIILGLNAYHGDAAACLVQDGELIAAAEEERFRRVKHWAGFPSESIKYCLREADASIQQIDHIAVNRSPNSHLFRKLLFAATSGLSVKIITDRLRNAAKIQGIKDAFCKAFNVQPNEIKAVFHNIEHHRTHIASAFLVSPFDSAAVVSVDGFGDFVSTMWGTGKGSEIFIDDKVYFPHSLGLFYLAMTQYLGFKKYGDEYKVMGLAPYGNPTELEKMKKIVRTLPDGKFELGLEYFRHHKEGAAMTWESGEPEMDDVYSTELAKLLGPERKPDEPITRQHKNIAASMQQIYEDVFSHILDHVYKTTRSKNLCLAGGCAMNSVANGKIFERTGFKDIYVQSAAGDAGGAIGAAFTVWNNEHKGKRSFIMDHAYWGPEFSDVEVAAVLQSREKELADNNCVIIKIEKEEDLCRRIAEEIAVGKVIGWFQGRMEWGPRALGNRSILCDPRRSDMKDILNIKIKRRESFRPFAPSILRDAVHEWFETDYDVPFMLQVYQIIEDKRKLIPAVTHVNGSGRLQTVTKQQNSLYYELIKSFQNITGVPVLLNTSFNENEPVVCRPEEALDCFLRTKMDILVLDNWIAERKDK